MNKDLQLAFEQLKKNILSSDTDLAMKASEELPKIAGEKVVNFLISLLDSDDVLVRNRVALSLHDLRNDKAVQPLLKAIFKAETLIKMEYLSLH